MYQSGSRQAKEGEWKRSGCDRYQPAPPQDAARQSGWIRRRGAPHAANGEAVTLHPPPRHPRHSSQRAVWRRCDFIAGQRIRMVESFARSLTSRCNAVALGGPMGITLPSVAALSPPPPTATLCLPSGRPSRTLTGAGPQANPRRAPDNTLGSDSRPCWPWLPVARVKGQVTQPSAALPPPPLPWRSLAQKTLRGARPGTRAPVPA